MTRAVLLLSAFEYCPPGKRSTSDRIGREVLLLYHTRRDTNYLVTLAWTEIVQ